VHGTGVYSAGVGPKGPALKRFPDIKKEKKGGLSPPQKPHHLIVSLHPKAPHKAKRNHLPYNIISTSTKRTLFMKQKDLQLNKA
jgi:hypothetical protein